MRERHAAVDALSRPRAVPLSVRVAIADDHAVVRAGYRRLLELEEGLTVVAEFGDGESAYHWLVGNPADVLILDLAMPGRGGLATLQRLHKRLPELRIMIFTMHDSPTLAVQALRLGAAGYLTKNSPPEDLIEAVHEIGEGGQPISREIAYAMRGENAALAPHRRLSPRQFDIFVLLAQGMDIDEIAARCCLSVKTIANYQTVIRQKTGFANALEMHRYALTHGLVALPGLQAG
jgi:DNA-binding NarL/FixJ family response regulator